MLLARRGMQAAARRQARATPLHAAHATPAAAAALTAAAAAGALPSCTRAFAVSAFTARRIEQLRRDVQANPDDALKQKRLQRALERAEEEEQRDSTLHDAHAAHQQQQYQQQYAQYAQQQAAHAYAHAGGSSSSTAYGANPLGSKTNPVIVVDAPYEVIPWWESFLHAAGRVLVVSAIGTAGYFVWVWLGRPSALSGMLGDMGQKKDFLSRQLSSVRFSDVKGCDEAKAELVEVVEFLKNPAKFERLGGRMTKGVLLVGPPGTGKTLLAKAVAGEAGVPFFAAAGSEFDEMFVGVGAARLRELFAAARKQKRAIIFIDEIDAVGGSRDRIGGSMGRATINALLTEMDGFAENSGIVVIGATNHAEGLDAALVRPGRFDRTVPVALPDAQGRLDILQHYGKKLRLSKEVDLKLLSQTTAGMTGADLSNLLNGAATRASAHGKTEISHDEIEYAYDRALMGAERQFTQSPAVKASTAYHEAGHTIMLMFTPGANELHKVTILPRGRALGVMFSLPYNEKGIMTRKQLRARLDIAMGGRVAEELLHGKEAISSGASSDLENASQIARQMVMQLGMGERTGVFTMPQAKERGLHPAQLLAPETLQAMDEEVQKLLKDSYQRALDTLTKHRAEWERLAQALIEHEVLDAKQVRQAVEGLPVTKKHVHKFVQPLATPAGPAAPAPPSAAGTKGGVPVGTLPKSVSPKA